MKMKSLSPNAQEFVPVSYSTSMNNQAINTPPHGVMLIQPNPNSSSATFQQVTNQVVHNFIQQQPQQNQHFPPPSPTAPSTNNTGSNNQLNMFCYPSQMPLNPALLPHQYNQVYYQDYQPSIHQQNKQVQNIQNYKKNHNLNYHVKNNHQRQKSGDSFTFNRQNRKFSNGQLPRPNSIARNQPNNLNPESSKPLNVPLVSSEKEWPSLKLTNKQNDLKVTSSHDKENSVSSETESSDENQPFTNKVEAIESYIVDQTTLRKFMQNVNLIKKTVAHHYLNENSKESSKIFPFREAVLKPSISKVEAVKTQSPKTEIIAQPVAAAPEKPKKKRNRKKKSDQQSVNKTDNQEDSENRTEFNLKNEDFPDLDLIDDTPLNESFIKVMNNSNKSTVNNSSIEDNDANYSSDATVDVSLKTQSCSQLSDKKQTSPLKTIKSSGKKLNRPIIVEFANMISALEKGQKQTKNRQHHQSGNNLNSSVSSTTKENLKRSKSQIISSTKPTVLRSNPLDSCPTVQRGKEREKPKQKKHSTLKKIILKEREEKRLLKSGVFSAEILDQKLSSLDIDKTTGEIAETNTELVNKSESSTNAKVSESEFDEDASNDESEEAEALSKSSDEEDLNEENNNPQVIFLHENDLKQQAMSNQMSPISQGSPISIGGYTPTTTTTTTTTAVVTTETAASNSKTLICIEKLEEQVKQKIHNRKFREYCNQIINRDIDEVCSLLLHEIVRFQDRMYHKNPARAKAKRRYVMGIREVTKHLKLKKLRCVILAPNCEKIQSKGGLDDAINTIIQMSMEQNVPFLFALGRKSLGKAVSKLVPISVVGIFDYAGAEEYFRRLVSLANNAKLAYQEMIEEYEKEECESLITEVKQTASNINSHSNLFIAPSHFGHSRTSSNGSNISIDPNILFHHSSFQHGHKRSASGNFNMGHSINTGATRGGHHRSASGGGGVAFNSMSLSEGMHAKQHWTHSRTPSNCSNNSFISRMSEPISEVGSCGTLHYTGVTSASQYNLVPFYIPNNPSLNGQATNMNSSGASLAAVQYYSEQVRQEMRESNPENFFEQQPIEESISQNPVELNTLQGSLVNLHLGCINEIDQGNEADTEDTNPNSTRKQTKSIEPSSIKPNKEKD